MSPDLRTFVALQTSSMMPNSTEYIDQSDEAEAARVSAMRDANGVGEAIEYLDIDDIGMHNLAEMGVGVGEQ